MNQETNVSPLAKTYRRKIGRVTFEISSFGNPSTDKSSSDLLLSLMEGQINQTTVFAKEEMSA